MGVPASVPGSLPFQGELESGGQAYGPTENANRTIDVSWIFEVFFCRNFRTTDPSLMTITFVVTRKVSGHIVGLPPSATRMMGDWMRHESSLALFSGLRAASDRNASWWRDVEPIWLTAARNGLSTALWWPDCEVRRLFAPH